MSKTTKIIAALGVVAGLGVAALPAFTYAATVSGNADVLVEIEPAIAMSIVGNQDGVTGSGYDNVKIKSDNINNINGTDVTSFVTTNAATSGSKTTMLPYSVVNGGTDDATFKSTINVYTNAAYYNLTVKDNDNDLALKNGTYEIPAGTIQSGDSDFDLSAGTAAWGYVVDTASSDGTHYKAIEATEANIKHAANSSTETVVYYGVATAATQATGVYSDTIVYTATSANS